MPRNPNVTGVLANGSFVLVDAQKNRARLTGVLFKPSPVEGELPIRTERDLGTFKRNEFGYWESRRGRFFSNPLPCGLEIMELDMPNPPVPLEDCETLEEHAQIMAKNRLAHAEGVNLRRSL